jgi:SNF2 family DNA or RNA helicase
MRELAPEAAWGLRDGVLVALSDDGAPRVPSAAEVFAAEYVGPLPCAGRQPSADLPNIEFSRFPASLLMRLVPSASASAVARVALVARVDGREVTLRDAGADHFVVDGTWYPLVSGEIERARAKLASLGLDSESELDLGSYARLRSLLADDDLLDDQTAEADRPTTSPLDLDPAASARPTSFTGDLYPYQAVGASWLSRVTREGIGCVLADEMGLGKTIQLIEVMCGRLEADRGSCLVVAPSTLLENWRREIAKFAPTVRVKVHSGPRRTGFPRELSSCDVVVTSYDVLRVDLPLFSMVEWDLVVVDEAQNIKNPDAARTVAIKRVPRAAGIAVTGTPLENRLTDLWSIVDFAIPGYLGDRHAYDADSGDQTVLARRLERLVSPIMLRRTVAEVASDLPDLIDIPQALLMEPEEAGSYETLRCSAGSGPANLGALMPLRMFCAHPCLRSDGGAEAMDPDSLTRSSVKYRRLCEILQEIILSGEKALVFAPFRRIVDMLVFDVADRFRTRTAFIDGRVPIQSRQTIVDEFNATLGPAVLVLNPRAAGTGLNITGANHVIHYCLEWNPAVVDQATARAYRRGQHRPVTVHKLYYLNTVEEVMWNRLEAKRNLADTAVVGVDGKRLDRQDIMHALQMSPVSRDGT